MTPLIFIATYVSTFFSSSKVKNFINFNNNHVVVGFIF